MRWVNTFSLCLCSSDASSEIISLSFLLPQVSFSCIWRNLALRNAEPAEFLKLTDWWKGPVWLVLHSFTSRVSLRLKSSMEWSRRPRCHAATALVLRAPLTCSHCLICAFQPSLCALMSFKRDLVSSLCFDVLQKWHIKFSKEKPQLSLRPICSVLSGHIY